MRLERLPASRFHWLVIFLFASPAASSAYLTLSEIFPLETRGLALAFFFAIGTGIGCAAPPWLFESLIVSGSRLSLLYGYLAGAAWMLNAVGIEAVNGIKAEQQSLEKAKTAWEGIRSFPLPQLPTGTSS